MYVVYNNICGIYPYPLHLMLKQKKNRGEVVRQGFVAEKKNETRKLKYTLKELNFANLQAKQGYWNGMREKM